MTLTSATLGTQWFLDGISNLQRRQLETQRQLSSGYRIQDAADAPEQTAELISLGSSLATTQGYQTNLDRVQTEISTADQALGSAVSIIEQARSLAVQGASSIATASDRATYAAQIQALQASLVSVANTTVEGRYIFGGDQDQTPPYQLNPASANGVDALTDTASTRSFVNPSGLPVFHSLGAGQVFDNTTDNAFTALQSLVTALQANDPAATGSALTLLKNASVSINQSQAHYGAASQNVAREQSSAVAQATAFQTRIAAMRDTDVAAAASDLTQETTAQTAAFAALAQIPRKSLFDYLG